ncbi:MAG TPA: DNA repair protein RecO [bacterium]|nr:DNA repair protein RecO [bacterium]
MSVHRTQAVVLRSRKIRESSKIVVLFSQNYGKISTIAKGSLKPKSKFGSSLELFTHSSIMFYRKENRELHTLSHSDIVNSFDNIKKDFVKLAYASVAGEVVERLVPQEEPNKPLFALLVSVLGEFAAAERPELEIVLSSYQLKMLHLIGYGPELAKCVRCSRAVDDRVWFGLLSGGILCPMCKDKDLHAVAMSEGALAVMRLCESEPLDKLRRAYPADGVTREVADILNSFVRVQLGERPGVKSLDFLERIRDAGNA